MNFTGSSVVESIPTDISSLIDLRLKLFPEKFKIDRSIAINEERYTLKTLVGNWYERKAVETFFSNDWKTLYQVDYTFPTHGDFETYRVAQWDNRLNLEGIPGELLLGRETCYDTNKTSTYDLNFNILKRNWSAQRMRSYNTKKQKWVPEQDFTQNYGSLTNFGLLDTLKKEWYENSPVRMEQCRWRTTYEDEIGTGKLIVKHNARFNKKRIDMNVPNLEHFNRKSERPCPEYLKHY